MTDFDLNLYHPVFLVGFPRSGTTYLQSLLATQENIISFPETHFYSVLTGHMEINRGLDKSQMEDMLERATRYHLLDNQELNLLLSLPDVNGYINRKTCYQSLLSILIARQADVLQEGQYILDKTPSHCLNMDEILADYPQARFIYLLRHPVDAISSYLVNLNDTNEDLSVIIDKWKRHYDYADAFMACNPGKVYTLKYEDIRLDMTGQVSSVLDFMDLKLDAMRLADYPQIAKKFIMPFETWKSDNTSKKYEHSKSKLTVKEKLEIEYHLSSRMKESGYPVKHKFLLALYQLKNGRAI